MKARKDKGGGCLYTVVGFLEMEKVLYVEMV
jgi:hypothetical protein